uniref:U6 snRNA-associated Sm-like protein LSm1 n=1 Tax=Steinernema glaseri TaxID=37863 RepID=A0A1I8AD40_9BILA
MNLPDPYLPGAVSLLDQLDKRLLVILRDGRTLVGYLRTIDQFANLVLHETLERIHVDKFYGDIPRGIFLIRGENVVLAGEMSSMENPNLIKVSVDDILSKQAEKAEERERADELKNQILQGKGIAQPPRLKLDTMFEDNF